MGKPQVKGGPGRAWAVLGGSWEILGGSWWILGGPGGSGTDLAKKVEKVSKSCPGDVSIWRSIFDHYRQNVGIKKEAVFQTLHFRPKIGPGPPKVSIIADLGPKR